MTKIQLALGVIIVSAWIFYNLERSEVTFFELALSIPILAIGIFFIDRGSGSKMQRDKKKEKKEKPAE
ncbi:hypothetical protein SAMN04488034_11718 [Salinimicrobium catena]|uniref:Uncharacterized protein n=1 Tax=Salinimicrobium catena TaxID=390640 RepID=A0A1H5PIZ9_9FLAO|nr:hypothetical protein [Salinimicrobium catena]SDL84626.1 hypothetical protein SAMN04488140_11718 [Salinimicrobium catena]SEF13037.1 hypothetical protein SAMN04488034_11718 [Salinimicrobium catena]